MPACVKAVGLQSSRRTAWRCVYHNVSLYELKTCCWLRCLALVGDRSYMRGTCLWPSGAESWQKGQRRTWTFREKEAYSIVMALRKCAGYIALHPVTVFRDHQSPPSWHKEQVDTPSDPASGRATWHLTLAKRDLKVVSIKGKYNTMADCLSRRAHPASKGMRDVSTHDDEAETAEANRIIDDERMMEEEGVKCFFVRAADAPPGRSVSRAVRVLAPEGAQSNKHIFPE